MEDTVIGQFCSISSTAATGQESLWTRLRIDTLAGVFCPQGWGLPPPGSRVQHTCSTPTAQLVDFDFDPPTCPDAGHLLLLPIPDT